jgi:hypothetical protein
MNWISHLSLRYLPLRDRRKSPPSIDPSLVWQDLEMIEANILPHLGNIRQCNTIREIQEYYLFRLHRNFFGATVCRSLVSPSYASTIAPELRSFVVSRVQNALRQSAQAYLDIRSLSVYATRSWAFIHSGLASVLLLSLIPDTRCDTETTRLQDEYIQELSDNGRSNANTNDTSINFLSATLKKALKALVDLRRLAEQESTRPATRQRPTNADASTAQPQANNGLLSADMPMEGGEMMQAPEYRFAFFRLVWTLVLTITVFGRPTTGAFPQTLTCHHSRRLIILCQTTSMPGPVSISRCRMDIPYQQAQTCV